MLHKALLLLLICSFYGCVHVEFYRDYSRRTDSLSGVMEEMAAEYLSLDTVLIRAQYDSLREYLDSLSAMPDITLDSMVVVYKYIGKDYKTFWQGHPLTIRELGYSRRQLADLKHDLDHYQLDKPLAETYYLQERESVRKLRDRMDLNMVNIQKSMRQFRETTPGIIFLLDSLQKVESDE